MRLTLRYFAALGDAAGCSEETVDIDAIDPRALYAELAARHRFPFARSACASP